MIKLRKYLFTLMIAAAFTTSAFGLAGCSTKSQGLRSQGATSKSSGSGEASKDKKAVESIKKTEKYNIKLQLENYSKAGIFTLQKPKDWKVYNAGEYNTLAFLTRDEKEPLRQAFMFGEIGLFYVDKNQKDTEVFYQNNGGYKVPWIDMPVVAPYNGTNFFKNLYSIMNSQIGKGFLGATGMPVPSGFQSIEIISEEKTASIMPGTSTVVVRALLKENNKLAQGMFTVTTYRDAYGHGSAYLVAGVTAPVNEFISVKDTLTKVIESFKMEDAYVRKGVSAINENGERFRQISETISETSDIITKGWNDRNKSLDVTAAKRGDQIMGVERVYDPASGEVYEVENGFYDYYKTHQEQYPQKDLQPLPDNNYDLWDKAPLINHSLVMTK